MSAIKKTFKCTNNYLHMKRLKCLVVDDELTSISALSLLIKNRHDLVHSASTQDAREAIELVEKHHIELAFVDLHMPHIHGLDLIRQLSNRLEIVCCSGDKIYGEQLFELGIAFYLTKPIKKHLFDLAIQRVWESIERSRATGNTQRISPIALNEHLIFQMTNGLALNLQLSDIECMEAQGDNTLLTHTDGTAELCFGLGKLEKLLPVQHFIRVHRSFMVAFKNIGSIDYTNNKIMLRNSAHDTPVPIGREYRSILRDTLKEKHVINKKYG